MKRLSYLTYAPISFYFKQSERDFVVEEIPLYEFSNEGEHLILKIRKKNLTTWDVINLISQHLGIHKKEIGYAGLKDKNAMSIQYISFNKKYEDKFKTFKDENIKILEQTYHNNKIKLGHLKGNKFFVRLKKVNQTDSQKIKQGIKQIKKFGMPNFFGHQRFGIDGDNYLIGKELIDKKRQMRDKTKREFFMNSYQSYLFNLWLNKRIEVSLMIDSFEPKDISSLIGFDIQNLEQYKKQQHPFKIFSGDIGMHYPYGRIFDIEDINPEEERFLQKDISLTGALFGKKTKIATKDAQKIEEQFFEDLPLNGQRRYAWVFPEIIDYVYKDEQSWFELNFILPKGSYATILIEQLEGKK